MSKLIPKRCPRCGSNLLSDGVLVWCSFVGGKSESIKSQACAFGIDKPVLLSELDENYKAEESDPILKRGGRLRVTRDMVMEHPRELLQLLSSVLIIRCEMRFEFDGFLYEGFSECFTTCEEGVEWPYYQIITHRDNNGNVTYEFEKIQNLNT